MAVKAFRLDVVPEDVSRFADALRRFVAAGVTRPGIVPVLGAGLEGGTAFLAMEYIAGETLDIAFRHLAPAPISRALPILQTMAGAIDAAAAAGFPHGALHPRDIFFKAGSDDVIVTGFGIVAALESLGFKPPARRPYAAPERIAGEPADLRSDVYSLGAIAHELLTRRRPAGPGEQEGALATGVAPEHRDALRRVLSTALAERAADRFPSASAFVAALAALHDNAAVPAVASAAPLFEHLDKAHLPSAASELGVEAEEREDEREDEGVDVEEAESDEFSSREHTGVYMHRDGSLTPVALTQNWEAALEKPIENPVAEPVAAEPAAAAPIAAAPPAAADVRIDKPLPVPVPLPLPIDPRAKDWDVRAADVPPGDRPDVGRDRRPLPPALFASVGTEPDPTQLAGFPWAAVIAGTLAGLTLGGVGGYQLGIRQPRPPVVVQTVDAAKVPAPATPPPAPPPTTSESATPPGGATAAANGRIAVHSVPSGATLTIDGKSHGTTPQTISDLPLGTYSVQVARPGFGTKTETVDLTAASPSSEITITLTANAAAARGTAPKSTPTRGATPPPRTTTARTGILTVNSNPAGATVRVDGKSIGVTPARASALSVGTHTVIIERAGYKTFTQRVTIKAGATERISISLERAGTGPR